jgi:hypothetical protein
VGKAVQELPRGVDDQDPRRRERRRCSQSVHVDERRLAADAPGTFL